MILHCYNEGKTHFDNNDDWWSQNLIQSYFETTSYMKNFEGEMSEIMDNSKHKCHQLLGSM